MINPQLGIDTWEGQLEIDENILKENNVNFIFIRLNSISGGHHKDDLFDKQWKEAEGFYRAPYFVYNPWVSGQANYDWLLANMPADAVAFSADIEVIKQDYPPLTYANEVDKFITLCKNKWNTCIYTGEWFLPLLSYWRIDVNYWWAQYPNEFYPPQPINLTWDELRDKLLPYDKPFNYSKVPGHLMAWQFSGDKLILPGNPRIMDVNVFYDDLENFFGKINSGETMEPGTAKEKLGKTSTVRTSPGVVSGNDTGLVINPYSTIQWLELVDGINFSGDKWFKMPNGYYVQYIYNGRQYYDILTEPTDTTSPPSGGDEIIIEVNGTATITLNGNQIYP